MPPCHCQPLPPLISRHVAVIGAGAAGLIAARELRREGHKVVVFERENQVGGTWVYTPQVERDPLGLDPTRPIIHSSLYKSLRTNLPREVMGFTDYPFVPRDGEGRDPRRFPGHREVLLYLEDFAQEFEVDKMVRFETEVLKVWYLEEGSSDDGKKNWRVRSKRKASNSVDEEVYDAVVVCNGHYTEPRLAEVPGISSWPGKQMHSHNYRTPESFRDQVVILIGSAASAVDISREVAEVAKEVHISSRGVVGETYEKQHGYDNLWLHSMIESAHEDGSMVFHNGRVVYADIILHCTGYKYQFPFLETNGIVTVDDNRVGPLYKHVFPPDLAPFLSFVGLPFKVIPFPLSELQSKWIAGVLSGQIVLPSPDEMMEDVKAFYMALEASNRPRHHTHNLGNSQFDYDNWLASQSMSPAIEEWRKLMYVSSSKSRNLMPESYRDEWKDEELVSEAYKYFATLERYNGCISL